MTKNEEKEIPLNVLIKFIGDEIDRFLVAKKKEGPIELWEMIEHLREYMNSGKRIRPILFYYGYLIADGKDKYGALKAAIAIEFVHASMLIFDDIQDEADVRRGKPSMHCRYEEEAGNGRLGLEPEKTNHFGESMAQLCGILALQYGYEILETCNFYSRLKVKAINKLTKMIVETIAGQKEDIYLSLLPDYSDPNRIMNMTELKTAKYTFEGPLLMGATLAGADDEFLEYLSDFAIPLGTAFQIQDDILGAFGDKNKTGKSSTSDISEGKKTILMSLALTGANIKQKKEILSVLGKKEISSNDIERVREIIEQTGSLGSAQRKIKDLVKRAKKQIETIKAKKRGKKIMEEILGLAGDREK